MYSYVFDYELYSYVTKPENVQLTIVSGDESRAVTNVKCIVGFDARQHLYDVECRFEKTADGWRLADGAFVDMFKQQYHDDAWREKGATILSCYGCEYEYMGGKCPYLSSTQTSDSDAFRAVIFAGVGALAHWGVVAVTKRRRRISLRQSDFAKSNIINMPGGTSLCRSEKITASVVKPDFTIGRKNKGGVSFGIFQK